MRVQALASAIAMITTACSFSLTLDNHAVDDAASTDTALDSPLMSIDAPMIDAAPPIDAGPDAMQSWVQVEMIDIPCIGTEVQSTTVLAAQTTYRLRATGDCIANDDTAGGDVHGDAEYIWNQFGTEGDSANVDMGLAINDTTPGMVKLPNWGSYTTSHSYTTMWMGLGAAIVAKYHDPNYTNNSGQLRLYIDAFQ